MAQALNPGSTQPNLLYINCSPPSDVREAELETWLTTRHLPSIVDSGTVARAALYKEVGFRMIPQPTHPLKYMILYQTNFRRVQDHEKYIKTGEDTNAVRFQTVGEDDSRNYEVRRSTIPDETSCVN